MAACLQGLDSYRASDTANTDDWVEEEEEEEDASTTIQIFIDSLSLFLFLHPFLCVFLTFNNSLIPVSTSFKFFFYKPFFVVLLLLPPPPFQITFQNI